MQRRYGGQRKTTLWILLGVGILLFVPAIVLQLMKAEIIPQADFYANRYTREFLPTANGVWKKVMFSQACVILLTGGGFLPELLPEGVLLPELLPGGRCLLPEGGAWSGGRLIRGGGGGRHPEMATGAVGTHPT